MDRPKTDLEIVGERCAEVIRSWASTNPDGNREGLRLIAEFCWALGLTPHLAINLMRPAQGIETLGEDALAASSRSDESPTPQGDAPPSSGGVPSAAGGK